MYVCQREANMEHSACPVVGVVVAVLFLNIAALTRRWWWWLRCEKQQRNQLTYVLDDSGPPDCPWPHLLGRHLSHLFELHVDVVAHHPETAHLAVARSTMMDV